ncbi:DNA repair protein RadA [Thermocrinis sp.]
MKKDRAVFVCQNCGYSSYRWFGKCPSCGSWNSMVEERERANLKVLSKGMHKPLSLWDTEELERLSTGMAQINNALGGGIVRGQVILIAGEPGIGKSTLLLQLADKYSKTYGKVLYVSGEESGSQIAIRARRLGVVGEDLYLLPETNLENILDTLDELNPNLLILDSIQTIHSSEMESAPGSVSQVRECAYKLSEVCKKRGIPLFIVGQVNKEGNVAGPKVLEHLVDTVLYFEGERFSFYRVLKVIKNRFGASGEMAVLRMTDGGLEEVPEPSALFLRERVGSSGSVVFPHTEGSKPVLLEVQALTIDAIYTTPQRRSQGYDINRLALILAVLEKEAKVFTKDKDVFINVVGGMQIVEPAGDLAVALAVCSSVKNKELGDVMVFGELGLGGEVRAVHFPELRLKEGKRFGFTKAVVPKGSMVEEEGMEVYGVSHIREALELLL